MAKTTKIAGSELLEEYWHATARAPRDYPGQHVVDGAAEKDPNIVFHEVEIPDVTNALEFSGNVDELFRPVKEKDVVHALDFAGVEKDGNIVFHPVKEEDIVNALEFSGSIGRAYDFGRDILGARFNLSRLSAVTSQPQTATTTPSPAKSSKKDTSAVVTKLANAGQRAANAAQKLKKISPKIAQKLAAISASAIKHGAALKRASKVVSAAPPPTTQKPATTPAGKVATKPAKVTPKPTTPLQRGALRHSLQGQHTMLAMPMLNLLSMVQDPAALLNMSSQLSDFADQSTDAAVAGEALVLVSPLLGQLKAANLSDPSPGGQTIIDRAQAIITNAPANPPASGDSGGGGG